MAAAQAAKARIRQAAEGRILHAAAELFADTGSAGTTVGQVAARAGMSAATVHYYFRSKAILYEAVLSDVLRRWLHEIEQIDERQPPEDAIAAYVRAKMHVSYAHPAASRIVAQEMLRGGSRMRRFLSVDLLPLLDRKLRLIEGWSRSGLLRPVDGRHLFFLIWAGTEFYANFSVEAAAVLGVSELTEAEMRRAADSVVDLVLNGLQPRPG